MPVALSAYTVHVGHTSTGTSVTVPLYAGHRGQPLMITGGMGTGKSVLLHSIAAQAQQAGREVALHSPIPTGAALPEGVIGIWNLALLEEILDSTSQQRLDGHRHAGLDLLLLDDAGLTLSESTEYWDRMLPRALAAGITVVAVTHTLHLGTFGRRSRLRDRLLGGSVIRTWTPSMWDRQHERVVDLAALPRIGGAYVQTPADDAPVAVLMDPPAHL